MSSVYGQNVMTLDRYIDIAGKNSPLLQEYRGQIRIAGYERERLKALYTRSKLELNGELLFVPVISRDNGLTSFKLNSQDAKDYYGYDLGQSSGHFHAGATWNQPLLGASRYRIASEQSRIDIDMAENNICLEEHQLKRAVTEQYILCFLDRMQMDMTDSLLDILSERKSVVERMVNNGIARQSDMHLISIEMAAACELRHSARESFRIHLLDLNLICGINDTASVEIGPVNIEKGQVLSGQSMFDRKYHLDSLSLIYSLKGFNQQYRPQLDFFADAGMRTGDYSTLYKHLGISAGLTFKWAVFDGGQKRRMERKTSVGLGIISSYQRRFQLQRDLKRQQYLEQMDSYEKRQAELEKQLKEYDEILDSYRKEMSAGQRSVLDFITVLRNRIQARRDFLVLSADRQLLIAGYNYWNW